MPYSKSFLSDLQWRKKGRDREGFEKRSMGVEGKGGVVLSFFPPHALLPRVESHRVFELKYLGLCLFIGGRSVLCTPTKRCWTNRRRPFRGPRDPNHLMVALYSPTLPYIAGWPGVTVNEGRLISSGPVQSMNHILGSKRERWRLLGRLGDQEVQKWSSQS